MPTINPRVNVTLSPSTDDLVQRIARLQKVSKSQVLRELLEAAEPALQRAAALMEAASTVKASMLAKIANTLDKEQSRAEVAYRGMLAAADAITADLVTQAQAVRGRRPAGSARSAGSAGRGVAGRVAAPQNPPPSNRGVKSTKRGASRATIRGQK